MKRATRRGFLAALGAAGAGATLGPGADAAAAAGATGAVPFYGAHQAGITTSTQEHLQFLALDVASDAVSVLVELLAALTAAAALLTAGRPVGPMATGDTPPVDTGEAVGLRADRLTITFGLGPAIFRARRFGLEPQRPAPLVELPSFATDALDPGICGGDIAVQVCADDPQVAFHAVHDLIRLASPTAVPRWLLAGFGPTLNAAGRPTPRNLFGFKDGTANIMRQDAPAVERFVWAGAPESPAWMAGGSYLVARRIQMILSNWDSSPLTQQESTIGREKLSGAPLGERSEYDPIDLHARTGGQPTIPLTAHIRLASPAENGGERILRRGYSYVDGVDPASGLPAAGLMFLSYQRDPRAQFIPIQRRLAAADALNQHIAHVGSAIFACPPGAAPGGYVGDGLFS